jgi:L-lactate utilization protein LutC
MTDDGRPTTDADRVLSRVRAALSSAAWSSPRPALPPSTDSRAPAAPVHRPELIARFVAGATSAGADVVVVDRFEEARAHLDRIVSAECAQSVVVSPDAATSPWTYERATAAHADVFAADLGVTTAAYGLADTGTLVLIASAACHRLDSLAPPVHVALLRASALVSGLHELMLVLARAGAFADHSAITLVRGPSRTADVELTLSIGVHGPKKLYVVIVDDRE